MDPQYLSRPELGDAPLSEAISEAIPPRENRRRVRLEGELTAGVNAGNCVLRLNGALLTELIGYRFDVIPGSPDGARRYGPVLITVELLDE